IRSWFDRLRYEAVRLLLTRSQLPTYELFADNHSHILGLGPGATSHIYGHSWYREVTAVSDVSVAKEPRYVGTRLTAEEGCRRALRGAFATPRWTDPRALARRSGVDTRATFGMLFAEGVRRGALRHVGGRYAASRDGASASHADFFESLLPSIPAD